MFKPDRVYFHIFSYRIYSLKCHYNILKKKIFLSQYLEQKCLVCNGPKSSPKWHIRRPLWYFKDFPRFSAIWLKKRYFFVPRSSISPTSRRTLRRRTSRSRPPITSTSCNPARVFQRSANRRSVWQTRAQTWRQFTPPWAPSTQSSTGSTATSWSFVTNPTLLVRMKRSSPRKFISGNVICEKRSFLRICNSSLVFTTSLESVNRRLSSRYLRR